MVYAVFVQAQWKVGSIGLVTGKKLGKNYYTDNHKKDTTIDYRWKFINRYIYYEIQAYLWVQLTLDESQTFFDKFSGLNEAGYLYVDADKGVDMVESHIDDCEEFIYLIKGTNYDEFPSFRFSEGHRSVMNIGHDECMFKQYIFLQSRGRVLMGKLYWPLKMKA